MANISAHQIRIGQIFRYGTREDDSYDDFYILTKGRHRSGVGAGGKGIFNYARIGKRYPAIILHSNPLIEGSDKTPWIDDINPDEGYAIYNGDNKSSSRSPAQSGGNKVLVEAMKLYHDPSTRHLAPPIIIFKQELVGGKRKGYRSFQGYGIPIRAFTRVEREPRGSTYYTNIVFEILIMDLASENDLFDWTWIDDRRDPAISDIDSNRSAPFAWKKWANGELAVTSPHIRRSIARSKVRTTSQQRSYSSKEQQVLEEIYEYYGGGESNTNRHLFEGLAVVISEQILGPNYRNGWITKRAGDGGVDFVGRLDLGIADANTSAVVLGQAKCIDPARGGISGLQLARVAARLKRGWIGIFVTSGAFNTAAQIELASDKYPIILVNGKTVAREVIKMMNVQKVSLRTLLDGVARQYETQPEPLEAERILDWEFPLPRTPSG